MATANSGAKGSNKAISAKLRQRGLGDFIREAIKGWVNYGDWLGTYTVAPQLIAYRSFHEARKFARKLGLKSLQDWRNHWKKFPLPTDIPMNPDQTYKKQGLWVNWKNWLTDRESKGFWSFKKARSFVRTLRLTNMKEWQAYCASGEKNPNIPSSPRTYYKNSGFTTIADWLGSRNLSNNKRKYRKFESAREFVRGLALKNIDA